MEVTAERTIRIPMTFWKVRTSPKIKTPQMRAVTGSSAPKMEAGVEPIRWMEAVMVIKDTTVGMRAKPRTQTQVMGSPKGCKSVSRFSRTR